MYRAPADAEDLRPLEADLAGLPPLHVVAGAAELLVDDADRLVERARAAGVPVTYQRAEGMWHDFPVLAGLLAEADAAVDGPGRRPARGLHARRHRRPLTPPQQTPSSGHRAAGIRRRPSGGGDPKGGTAPPRRAIPSAATAAPLQA